MRPVLEHECYHDGRGPTLERVVWGVRSPVAFEYSNPTDGRRPDIWHILPVGLEAYAFAGEEVHSQGVWTPGCKAAAYDLGQSDWLRSFDPTHLDGCSHFQVTFYDEVFDLICESLVAARGPYVPPKREPRVR